MVFVPRRSVDKPAIIVEMKRNKLVGVAIKQIKKRQHIESLKEYSCKVVFWWS